MTAKAASTNVARAGGITMIFLFLSRFLGLIREALISALFGQAGLTDAYQNAFAITDVLFFLIAGGALSSSFIPVFTELLTQEREEEAWALFSKVTCIMTVIVLAFIGAAYVAAPAFIAWYDPKATDPALVVAMSRILLPAQYAFLIGGLLFGTLYARGVFSVPGLGPNVYNLAIIFGAAVLSQFFSPGIVGVCWGAVIGAFLGNLVIPGWVMARQGAKFFVSFDAKDENVRKVFRLMLPVILGLSLPAVYFFIMRYFFNLFGEKGLVSALNNANTLMQAPLGIFGQSMAIGAFPALSAFFAQGEMDRFRAQMSTTLRTVLYLCIPISVIFILSGVPVIQALYEHGKFTHEATLRTAPILAVFAAGIFAWCLHPVLMRGFFAIQQSVRPIVITTITTFVFAGACWLAHMASLPYLALPLIGSAAAFGMVAALTISLQKQVGTLDVPRIVLTGFKSLAASVPGALLSAAVFAGLHALRLDKGAAAIKVELGVVLLLFGWLYYWASRLLKMPEADILKRAMNRLDRRAQAKNQPEG